MTAFNSDNLPPLIVPNVPASPPEPLIRRIRGRDEAEQFDSEEGDRLQVHCGGCLRRAFDLEITRVAWIGAGGVVESRRTNKVLVERACPKCSVINSGYVTLASGIPLKDGLRGPWFCRHCGASLAYVDANKGRIKASCKRCDENVTTSAYNAFSGNLKRVEDERARRWLEDVDAPY